VTINSFTYDVALSFAGEDRDFVKQVADILRTNGVRVFYDEFERANLWGKELIEYLEDIYKNKSRYVIIFISKSYLEKDWTNHERKSALNRAFKNKQEYILPVKLDDTVLPGIHESIGYLSNKNATAYEICEIFLEKIGNKVLTTANSYLYLYRLTRKSYASDLSGNVSALYGTRWSSKGKKIFFTSSSIPLASLEVLANLGNVMVVEDFVTVKYVIPSNIQITMIYESDLPKNWNGQSILNETIMFGDSWLEKNETCILSVPSTIIPNERNYVLNPDNRFFKELTIKKVEDFKFDKRLLNR
jgi:RES domain-containing protein